MVKAGIIRNKYFLYATEFFSGMSVMAVELGASRLLAPYFSSSQIVWTVIIGTIMIALAIGNAVGGKMADKNPDPARLYRRLLIAAVWIALIPFVGKFVIAGISFLVAISVSSNFLVWAALFSCFVIFVFPLVLLGTVTPSLIKFTVEDLENNGAVVGRLGALNTIGSILGTFLPTFVIIPAFGTALCFIIFSSVLAIISLLYFLSAGRFSGKAAAVIVLCIGLCFFGSNYSFAFGDKSIIHEDESIYNYLQVKETPDKLILSTNVVVGVQSVMMKNDRLTGMYYDYALAAPIMAGMNTDDEKNILILGLGTGTYATMCRNYFPNSRIEGVEIDEKISKLAEDYFGMPESIENVVYDGRAYLERAGKYSVIMVDTYQDITIPFQLSSKEFFIMVHEHLEEDGVVVINLNMTASDEDSLDKWIMDTVASVFPEVYAVQVANNTNTLLFAFNDADKIASFPAAYEAFCEESDDAQLFRMMSRVERDLQKIESQGRILTDDKAPVELLGVKVIDELIMSEMQEIKTLVKAGNWQALLQMIQ